MTNINTLIIAGNLTRNPELKQFPSGKSVCRFALAHNSRRFNKQTGAWEDTEPLYVECEAWDRLGAAIAGNYHQGTRLLVTGSLEPNNWTSSDGVKHKTIRLVVTAIAQQPSNPNQGGTDRHLPVNQPTYPLTSQDSQPWETYQPLNDAPEF